MLPALQALIALQQLDSAADAARKRLADLPAAEAEIASTVAGATAAVEAAKAKLQENHAARRQLDKDVAGIDTRLARFEDHRAAVKTNQEYTALLHEIATAKSEKDGVEERILVLMEEADQLSAELKAAEAALAKARKEGEHVRAALVTERAALEEELIRLAGKRKGEASDVDRRALGTYETLLKGRKGLAVSHIVAGHCAACHVRLRPHVEQQIRRNDSIVQCESCQRILYFEAPAHQ